MNRRRQTLSAVSIAYLSLIPLGLAILSGETGTGDLVTKMRPKSSVAQEANGSTLNGVTQGKEEAPKPDLMDLGCLDDESPKSHLVSTHSYRIKIKASLCHWDTTYARGELSIKNVSRDKMEPFYWTHHDNIKEIVSDFITLQKGKNTISILWQAPLVSPAVRVISSTQSSLLYPHQRESVAEIYKD